MNSILAETQNVVKANKLMNRMYSKSRPGMVLLYGDTGLGKTYYSQRTAFTEGWCYYRLRATETQRSFIQEIYKRLNQMLTGNFEVIPGSSSKLESACIEMFRAMPDLVFVVDEINLLTQFKKWKLLEVIRDLRDNADATIVMVGEHDTREALEAYNKRFFNRCEFVNFVRNTTKDVAKVIKMRSEVELSKELYDLIIQKTAGNLREVAKMVEEFERIAEEKGIKSLGLEDLEDDKS